MLKKSHIEHISGGTMISAGRDIHLIRDNDFTAGVYDPFTTDTLMPALPL